MDVERATVWSVVGAIVLTTLVSGPLVGAVDLTTEPETPAYGEGSVTVDSVAIPSNATLTAGRFDSGEYVLRVPDAAVTLAAIEGQPMLVYRLTIPERGYTRSTTHFITSDNIGPYDLSLADDRFDPETVAASQYDGQLEVLVRSNGTSRVVANGSIRVEVVE